MAYEVIDTSNFGRFLGKIKTLLTGFWSKSDTTELTIDSTPTANSNNLVKSGGVYSALATKADTTDIPDAVEANPTVPSGTTPTALANLKVGNDYYSVPQGGGSSVTISSDIASDKADNTKAGGAKAIYDFVKPVMQSSQPVGGMLPGVLYNLGTLTGSVTIDFAAASDATVENEYKFTFDADSTAPTITWPNSITDWAGNCLDSNGVPEIAASKHYEVSVIGAYGIIVKF